MEIQKRDLRKGTKRQDLRNALATNGMPSLENYILELYKSGLQERLMPAKILEDTGIKITRVTLRFWKEQMIETTVQHRIRERSTT